MLCGLCLLPTYIAKTVNGVVLYLTDFDKYFESKIPQKTKFNNNL